jgi:CheY-like chemotaxis protein
MNGLELVSKTRSSDLPHQPFFICMTGGISEEDLRADILKLVQGIINKPFNTTNLAETINKIFK